MPLHAEGPCPARGEKCVPARGAHSHREGLSACARPWSDPSAPLTGCMRQSASHFAACVSKLGVTRDSLVVVYDGKGIFRSPSPRPASYCSRCTAERGCRQQASATGVCNRRRRPERLCFRASKAPLCSKASRAFRAAAAGERNHSRDHVSTWRLASSRRVVHRDMILSRGPSRGSSRNHHVAWFIAT